jgi:hypothetical protein
MEFDESKKLEVEITENNFVENRIDGEIKKRRGLRTRMKERGMDVLDLCIVPVVLGVFVSLGFLFAGLYKAGAIFAPATQLAGTLASIF